MHAHPHGALVHPEKEWRIPDGLETAWASRAVSDAEPPGAPAFLPFGVREGCAEIMGSEGGFEEGVPTLTCPFLKTKFLGHVALCLFKTIRH